MNINLENREEFAGFIMLIFFITFGIIAIILHTLFFLTLALELAFLSISFYFIFYSLFFTQILRGLFK